MRTRIFLLSFLLVFSVGIFAQETQIYEGQFPANKTSFKRNGFDSNWFINLSAGGQVYNIENSFAGDILERTTFIPAVSVGKWVSPYWGFRLKGQGLTANSYVEETGGKIFERENTYTNVHLDAMWNLANYCTVYNPAKLFNFTPYVGIGWAHRNKLGNGAVLPNTAKVGSDYRNSSDALSFNGGIQFGFRLSNRINLDFDLGITYLGDYFDSMYNNGENDNIVHAMGGLTLKLGKTTFDAIEPMNYALLNDLNGKINSLHKENEELRKRQVPCPECPQVTPVAPVLKSEVNFIPNVVFFRLNSSKIDTNQEISIFQTAAFMKETGERIKVVGYADKGTGSNTYNYSISEKRAKAVAKELITKYNIPSEKISVEWKGSDEQPYPQNEWNRVVVMSAPK